MNQRHDPNVTAGIPTAPADSLRAADPEATTDPIHDAGSALTSHRVGTTLGAVIAGRYTLVEVIGEGGMGSVYLAEQTEPVHRQVALKLIKGGMDSRAVLHRFDAERQALAMMDHPNIARIYDGGVTPFGQPFFVMELVHGVPITQYCDEHHLDIKARLVLFVAVCQAVQHAHQKGIIHRDLKPGNVLVTEIDGRPTPKVIDFGVAKATEQQLTDQSFADTEAIVGTPAYMSPEQADPSSMDIDTRTDVYALGVILYELLTGAPPFDAKHFQRGAILEMLRMVREDDPPRPSTKLSRADTLPNIAANRSIDPAKLANFLRGELDWLVMKALEKDRTRRYDTVNALSRDIQRYLADEIVEARPPSAGYRLQKFVRRNKGRVIAASLVLLALLAGIAGTTFGLIRAKQKQAEADQAWAAETKAREQAQQERDRAKALNQFLIKDLLTSSDPNQAQGRDITVKEVLANAAARMETAFADRPDLEAAIRITLGNTYMALADNDAAEQHLQVALQLCREKLPDDQLSAIEASNSLALLRIHQGRVAEGTAQARENLVRAERLLGAEHPETLTAMDTLGTLLRDQGRPDEADDYLTKVLEVRRRILGDDSRETLVSMGELALLRQSQGQTGEAEQLLRETLTRYRRIFGNKHPDTVSLMNALGLVMFEMRELEKAEVLFQECLATRTVVQGVEHPDTLVAMHNLALAWEAQEKLEESIRLERRCLELNRRIRGERHPETLSVMGSLGSKLRVVGQLAEAESLLQEAVDKQRQLLGEEHPATLVMQANLASVLRAQGKLVEAESLLLRTKDAFLSIAGPDHPTTLQIHYLWASVLLDQNKLTAARKALEHSVAAYRRVFGLDHPNTQDALTTLGALLVRLGEPRAAEPLLRESLETSRRVTPPGHPQTLHTQMSLGACLILLRRFEEAEPLLRECLRIHENTQPDAGLTHDIQTLLGGALLSQKKYAEAEPLLLAGYEGMKQREATIPEQGKVRLAEALDRLIELYTATDKPDEVTKWQAERAKYPPPAASATEMSHWP